MGGARNKRRFRLDRALFITLVSGVGLLLLIGLVFSIATGSRQITTNATGLHHADETLRAATVTRAQVGLAVHLATVDQTFGTYSREAIELSMFEAEIALVDMMNGLVEFEAAGLLGEDGLGLIVGTFEETARDIIDLLLISDIGAARSLAPTLNTEFLTLVSQLEGVRDQLAASVALSDAFLGRIGDVARFLVAFLVPAAVIFIYRELLLRQQRQRELEGRLDSERHLSRVREEFIANASHELRTPLTGITGLAMLLAEDPALSESESASELLDLIISESGDLARMIEDLLTTARLDAAALHYDFEDIEICEEVSEVVEPMIRSGAEITVKCDPGLVRADQLRLRQVLRNLLSNAQKYGGSSIEVSGRVEGRTYVCSVSDDGPGIPSGVADRLFQRFVHQGKGTAVTGSVGLGLSIVHALLQGMGGSITHARTDGETRFTIRLPLVMDLEADHPFPRAFLTGTIAEQSTSMASFASDDESSGRSTALPQA
ncbi:MAG: ATP-binding protein [Acidimicrobiia bacterium]